MKPQFLIGRRAHLQADNTVYDLTIYQNAGYEGQTKENLYTEEVKSQMLDRGKYSPRGCWLAVCDAGFAVSLWAGSLILLK